VEGSVVARVVARAEVRVEGWVEGWVVVGAGVMVREGEGWEVAHRCHGGVLWLSRSDCQQFS
jgi:hypothetical protein